MELFKEDGWSLAMIERKEAEENRIIVKIMGDEYVIRGTDSPEYIERVVSYVEGIIDAINESQNNKLNKCQVAVLAALRIADELYKLRQEYQYLDDLLKESK
ncbi:MAG: cell division protein ZapA [Firmicutes bacterium]|nr:cell division protein ZapA [Bacillota bacterium]